MNFEYGLDRFCMQGNLNRVKELLSEGVDPNISNVFGNPLYLAVSGGYLEIVKELCLHKADPNIINIDGSSCLNQAICNKNLEMVQTLLFAPIPSDPNFVKYNGVTPLHLASRNCLDIVKQLFSAPNGGVDSNVPDEGGKTPLIWACLNGCLEIIKFLLDNGADPISYKIDGQSILSWARCYNYPKVAEILENYFPSLQNLSMRSIRGNRIDIVRVPEQSYSSVNE